MRYTILLLFMNHNIAPFICPNVCKQWITNRTTFCCFKKGVCAELWHPLCDETKVLCIPHQII